MKKILLAMVLLTTTFVSNNSMACDACGKASAVELRGAMQKLW
jgi:hypothetical protein